MSASNNNVMNSFPYQFNALVIGSSGAIGGAFVALLQNDPRCAQVLSLHRHSQPPIDFSQESSIAEAAQACRAKGPFHIIINAAGMLHSSDFKPEKKLAEINYAHMQAIFQANTFGPAMVLRHFSTLLDRERGVMAMLSAKVGSIEDNRLGGWYSYRASKAALNMLIKTAAIEIKRNQPNSVLVALHPGTVNSSLSSPFHGSRNGRPAQEAARDMLSVLDNATATDTGSFYSWSGERLPW